MEDNERIEYAVRHPEGDIAYLINYNLVAEKGISKETRKEIIALHEAKLRMYKVLSRKNCAAIKMKIAVAAITEIEFQLQDLWGFPRDANFHRFFETPGCSCPKLDNEDRYPYGHIISGSCKLHGGGL